jgi:hypothetical protein
VTPAEKISLRQWASRVRPGEGLFGIATLIRALLAENDGLRQALEEVARDASRSRR